MTKNGSEWCAIRMELANASMAGRVSSSQRRVANAFESPSVREIPCKPLTDVQRENNTMATIVSHDDCQMNMASLMNERLESPMQVGER